VLLEVQVGSRLKSTDTKETKEVTDMSHMLIETGVYLCQNLRVMHFIFIAYKLYILKTDMMAHICNPSTQEAEAGRS
jgi:hypothetical protein